MHITITGNLGSGKSTICKLLSEKYQYEVYSTGKVQRELAREMNMTTLELNQLMCSDKKYDKMIDDATTRISRENKDKDIIFDSRLAWHFVEHSFKVFVSVSLEVAAERVMNDQRGAEEKYSSLEEAKKLLAERAATERVRYKDIYNLNYMDFSNYNLIIDSTYCLPDKIAEIIIKEAKEFYKNGTTSETFKMLVSPKRLVKEADILSEDKSRLSDLINEYQKAVYAIEDVVTVTKPDDDYAVVEGLDQAKAAFLAKVPYVPIVVRKD
ncbi:MAG TPA: cytidylate kinase family protein [Mobilitalea sp.]|nr:cytidylate kinase family protein [Mobilitalea sp.]